MGDHKPTVDVVHKYCSDVPVSLNLIEENLYLGNLTAATDVNTLSKYKISHILTIDTCPLPRTILDLKHVTTMYIQLCDLPKEDLLSHFDDTFEFIANGMSKGVVYVHCYFGVSRSATVVIAFLMRKYELGYNEALDRVKSRRMVFPNAGFVKQLLLYRDMGFHIDKSHMGYKIFRLTTAADKVKKARILPQDYFDLIKADPGLTQTQPEPNVYRCKKCRRVLAGETNLITHLDESKLDVRKICSKTYFLEPLSWMAGITQSTQGKLHCPKCNNKVGSFSWIMGCQCPCGSQVAPAFYLCPSKVDWTNVVKNIECTI